MYDLLQKASDNGLSSFISVSAEGRVSFSGPLVPCSIIVTLNCCQSKASIVSSLDWKSVEHTSSVLLTFMSLC